MTSWPICLLPESCIICRQSRHRNRLGEAGKHRIETSHRKEISRTNVRDISFGFRQLPIFPVTQFAMALPCRRERHPCSALLTGLPPHSLRHRRRSAPPISSQGATVVAPWLNVDPKSKVTKSKRNTPYIRTGCSFWIPAATYLSGPSPAKYCRRMKA